MYNGVEKKAQGGVSQPIHKKYNKEYIKFDNDMKPNTK